MVGGSSGATLEFRGDWIHKECKDAESQVSWFKAAEEIGTLPHIYLPAVEQTGEFSYRIERLSGVPGTFSHSTDTVVLLYEQVRAWGDVETPQIATSIGYVGRIIEEHLPFAEESIPMKDAVSLLSLEWGLSLPGTFCHGDLTLENCILMPNGQIGIIDPNNKPGLYKSWVLDIGKILQSIHSDYHRRFDSCPGVEQTWMYKEFRETLKEQEVLRWGLLAEISHIVRLRKYRPDHQRDSVDSLLERLLQEYKDVYGLPS